MIRSSLGSGVKKNQAENEDSKVYDMSNIKGIANYEAEEGFNQNNENKHVKAQDSGNYNEANSDKKVQANENNFSGDKFHQASGGEISDFGKKSSTKKGHHKSGYKKSFHKDETGSSSSFYDDADDEGKEFVQSSKKNAYGDSGQQSEKGLAAADKRYEQDNAKKGYYDNAGNYEKDLANRRDYNSKQYYDNRENQGVRNAANKYGAADRYDQERYLHKSPHFEPYDPYYQRSTGPKRTITIYEDPRYDGYEKYPQYDGDYIQLDVKRPTRQDDYRHYDRRPYDYYY